VIHAGGKVVDDVTEPPACPLVAKHSLREVFHAPRSARGVPADGPRTGRSLRSFTLVGQRPRSVRRREVGRWCAQGRSGAYRSDRIGANVSRRVFFTDSREPLTSNPDACLCPPPPKEPAMAPTSTA